MGLSRSDYYEGGAGDETFGFFNVGAMASIPLPVSSAYGSWDLTGGVNFLFFGDGLKSINGSDDDVKTIGIVEVSVSY